MSFRVLGLAPDLFRHYFELSDDELVRAGARRVFADAPALPCRVSMAHAQPGDELVLVNFEHQPGHSPYRSNHAIYVNRRADRAFDAVDVVPEVITSRLVSVRAFDADHMIVDADVVEGTQAAALFERLLANPVASYLHVHNARRGCYSARVERA